MRVVCDVCLWVGWWCGWVGVGGGGGGWGWVGVVAGFGVSSALLV